MANITPRHDKAGNVISYRIRVSRGYDLEGNKLKPYEMTFKPHNPCRVCAGVSGAKASGTFSRYI